MTEDVLNAQKKYVLKNGTIPDDAYMKEFEASSDFRKYGESAKKQASAYYDLTIFQLDDILKNKK